MPRNPAIILRSCLALLAFEAGAAIFVGLSNLSLIKRGEAISRAGYFAIPTANTLPALNSLQAALGGGLFFTLTCGALFLFLALASWGLLFWGWIPSKKARILHIALAIFAIASLGALQLWPLHLGTVCLFAMLWPPDRIFEKPFPLKPMLFHAGVPLVLALLLFASHHAMPRGIFSGFRDAFLFENPVGSSIRNHYYTHTLFPAETFKPLRAKSQLAAGSVDALSPEVSRAFALLGHPILPDGPTDYTVRSHGDRLTFKRYGTDFEVRQDQFTASPRQTFNDFSAKADPFRQLRSTTWVGLQTGFPLLVYLLALGILTALFRLFLPLNKAGVMATATMGLLAGASMGLLATGSALSPETRTLLDDLVKKRGTPGYAALIEMGAASANPLVRYRTAQSIPALKERQTVRKTLSAMLKDPDVNVVCQAMGAMGRSRDPYYQPMILSHIAQTSNWYVQWYGYGALRRLGWHSLTPWP